MFKITPNPPEDESKKLNEAADRALAFYLDPKPETPNPPPGQLFTVAGDVDLECLLANLSETLASVNAMANELAFDLEGAQRSFALGIQQMVELSELLANRALDIAAPR
ncbi:hypothetical protein B1219_27290 [Pseudomonas ogarae]|uniref:DUF6124 family protein n=1 Tax=Pseudomonas ogarae (strain DSM 112162 / CECT 30235 / F113) TaxID=1114970 RepID=UPI0009A3E444|nr:MULTISPECIES: DUF6124 family protein [Pseudomonas]OPG69006.1 hypothetical protein B1219_27290 [Pseudomonas ogarae]OPG79348.1 hypothetical protein B1218_10795 [Pseudomonas ogarae]PBI97472.1 hypothetical protein BSF43_57700 [Pseudomonas ogarae]QXH93222.1 hypothetical protein HU749_020510 [Pseudomonas zarinae]